MRRLHSLAAVAACMFSVGLVCSVTGSASLERTSRSADIFVSPAGNDSCVRGDASRPCASFNRAYALSRPGDIVKVAPGRYPAQQLLRGSHPQTSPNVVFKCAKPRDCVIDGSLGGGVNNGQASGVGPGYLTFDGFDMSRWGSQGLRSTISSHITITNSWVHGWNMGSGSSSAALIGCCADNLTITNTEIGPACCDGDGVETGAGDNFTFSNNYVHDVYDTCGSGDGGMNRYGAQCRGTGWGDGCGICDHIDAMQLQGGKNIVITNNRIYNAGTQGIFLENAFDFGYNNVTIASNMVGRVCGGACGQEVVFASNTPGGISGKIIYAYNTVDGALTLGGGNTNRDFAPGATVLIVGNIANSWAPKIGVSGPFTGCQLSSTSGRFSPTYSHNLFEGRACDSTSIVGKASFVRDETRNPDLRLRRNSLGLGKGPVEQQSRLDIDGHLRPIGSPSDMGASQRETARIVLGRSIGFARIGASMKQILLFYGRPAHVTRLSHQGLRTARYRVHGGRLDVTYADAHDRVVGVGTTARYYRISGSLGIGSEIAQARWLRGLQRDPCRRAFSRRSNGTVVYYQLSADRRKLRSVSMLRERYAACGRS